MTDQMLHYDEADPVILASGARTATANTRCALCGRLIWRGRDRIATLPDARPAHISCVASIPGKE